MNRGDIDKQVKIAITEAIGWYTIAISSTNVSFEHGTGVPIKVGDKFYIVACRHTVVEEALDSNLRFFWRSEAPLVETRKEDIPKRAFHGTKEKLSFSEPQTLPIIGRILSNEEVDLAILEIDSSVANIRNLRFHEISDLDLRTPSPGTQVVLMGFPGGISLQVQHVHTGKVGAMVFLYIDLPKIIEPFSELADFDPQLHFLMDIFVDESFVKPHGMSGCGVWTLPGVGLNKIWSPSEIRLVGIQIGWYPKRQLYEATKIETLLKLIANKK